MKNIVVVVCLFVSATLLGQTTINTMFYNILDFPVAPPENRAELLQSILDQYEPDLLLVCELTSEEGANSILNTSLARSDQRYKKANFISNQSNPAVDLQQMAFYNAQKLRLTNQQVITTHLRDINHYTFVLNTTDSETTPIYLDAFVTHLKSSEGASNEQQRYEMVQDFTSTLLSIPSDHHVIFAGDLNLYSDQEPAYQELLDPTNAVVLKDPIAAPGAWHNNVTHQEIHTQATRLEPIGSHGAGGGLDDRFDFVLISESLLEGSNLRYVDQSYQAYGNSGNCYNKAINDPSCGGSFSQDLRNLLHNMSDHLPIVLQLQSDKTLAIAKEKLNAYLDFINGNKVGEQVELEVNPALFGQVLLIYNVLGQELVRSTLQQDYLRIDATQFKKGIYYISVPNTGLTPLKFIKH